jgi:predicted metal-dependent hydrolase
MLAWHAIEEMEHKAVAFDVMQNVAKVSYWRRISIMALFLPIFIYFGLLDTNAFLRADGFSWRQRFRLMMRGIAWAYGPKGVMTAMLKPWLAYFRRSFHPWQTPAIDQYTAWESAYTSSGDPIAAGEALYAAAR